MDEYQSPCSSISPQQLSGGQQQCVYQQAVVSNPKLVLADEPTGNLDSRNGKEVMDLLTELEFGRNDHCDGNSLTEGCLGGSSVQSTA